MPADSLDGQLQTSLGATYVIERELGGGGMSRVFVVQETALGRIVVIKVLPPELGVELSADRFAREIKVAAQLQDPRIVPVLAAGDAEGCRITRCRTSPAIRCVTGCAAIRSTRWRTLWSATRYAPGARGRARCRRRAPRHQA